MSSPDKLFGGYIPIIDQGYIRLIERHVERGVSIGVFATEISLRYAPYTRKELRALTPEKVASILSASGIDSSVMGESEIFERLSDNSQTLTLIADDISQGLLTAAADIRATVHLESPFLRWDRNNVSVNQQITSDSEVSSGDLDNLFRSLYKEAERSSDWWRHVGAAIFSENNTLVAMEHNRALPHDNIVNIESDPRILSSRGVGIDLSLFLHAEASCVASAAKTGTSIEGAKIYVTTFPCPNCAKIIAASGIKTVYFSEGYAMLDGQRVLEQSGVEIIKVNTEETSKTADHRLLPYPE